MTRRGRFSAPTAGLGAGCLQHQHRLQWLPAKTSSNALDVERSGTADVSAKPLIGRLTKTFANVHRAHLPDKKNGAKREKYEELYVSRALF